MNIGDQRPEDIQNLENQPFTSDALEHPGNDCRESRVVFNIHLITFNQMLTDDPEDIDENVSGFPIHKDTLNENKGNKIVFLQIPQ